MRVGFPLAPPGLRVGLLGGSFDPPHAGHVQITLEALRRFGIDRVWWLVSPGNPLKARSPAPLADRIAAAQAIMRHPRVTITGIEADLRTRFTADTIAKLRAIYPGVRFTWLMGADNLVGFHRWDDWQDILRMVPVGVLARPGSTLTAPFSRTARRFARARLPEQAATLLGRAEPPAWCLVHMPLNNLSSTAIRAGLVRP
ncbi:nicotinate-nucleotide adenylyltransferase [Paracoccus sp. p3-h83]|uniref:nicotinate-nucleotide adenylyltransferase n=1 Tax=Paracoccus sp. p3-h83 TaxID=3342805 RepID=UPI0035BA3C27